MNRSKPRTNVLRVHGRDPESVANQRRNGLYHAGTLSRRTSPRLRSRSKEMLTPSHVRCASVRQLTRCASSRKRGRAEFSIDPFVGHYSQAIWMHAMPGGRHHPQLALQHCVPSGQVTLPHVAGASGSQVAVPPLATQWVPALQRTVEQASVMGSQLALSPAATHCVPTGHSTAAHGFVAVSGTQAHTLGDVSKCEPITQRAFAMHWQIPPQSAPPLAGSQSSLGSSTHWPAPGQGNPAIPPQNTPGHPPLLAIVTPAAAA